MQPQKQQLKLIFHCGSQTKIQYQDIEESQIEDKEIYLSSKDILKKVRKFLSEKNISIETFINIWIESKGHRWNIFKLKKNNQLITLTCEKGYFQLNIIIEQGSEKSNLIKNFQSNYDSYQKLKNNLSRVLDQTDSKETVQKVQSENRPIDIAYFFADPLIRFSPKAGSNLEIMETQRQVSFQVQYDQFIDMVQREEFRRNFRIQMMAATETNIKNALIEGTSILHFSCHGDEKGNLHIEHQKNVGELAWLTGGTFMSLLENGIVPKIIIFNACYSYQLAKKVSQEKNIITVGFSGEALDKICQIFTKKFYLGIFRDKKLIKQLFEEIKSSILTQYPQKGKLLHIIFPEDQHVEDTQIISQPEHSKFQYKKRWKVLQSLRGNDCLGVKQEMYKIIKTITNQQRMNFLIIEGNKRSGKTNLIEKIKIYAINRKLFTDSLMIDLRYNNNGQSRQTMLAFRLSFEAKIEQFRSQLQKKINQQGRTNKNSLIIIDHAQTIIYYQYSQLIRYIEKQLKDKLNYGQIVILNRREEPYSKQNSIKYALAYKVVKEENDIDYRECQTFTKRYYHEDFYLEAKRIRKDQKVRWLDLIKAIKASNEPQDIKNNLFFQKIEIEQLFQGKLLETTLEKLEQQVEDILQDINYQASEHHHLYLSTILKKIARRGHRKTSLSQTMIMQGKENQVDTLIHNFKNFYTKAIKSHPEQVVKVFKRLIDLSFKIGGVCYLTKHRRQTHLINCQAMYVMTSVLLLNPYYEVQLKLTKSYSHGHEEQEPIDPHFDQPELRQVFQLLKIYKIQLLLTLFTYYKEREHELQAKSHSQFRQDLIQSWQQYSKKAQIVLDQLYTIIKKKNIREELQLKTTLVTSYKQLSHLIHHMQFNIYEPVVKSTHRKYSENVDITDDLFRTLTKKIHEQHETIEKYWKLLMKIFQVNNTLCIFSKDSEVLLSLNLIKLLRSNQSLLTHLNSHSPITRDMINLVESYLQIMYQIQQMKIFWVQDKQKSEYKIWRYPQVSSIKALFKTYYSMFVSAYFQLQKLNQSIKKNYKITMFNEMIKWCSKYPKINMVSIKKQIQTHKQNQFLNNYSCETYIAVPLVNYHMGYGMKINIKRYESHVHRFQQELFNNLERQIRHDIFVLDRQFFTERRHNSKSLIQLLIVNCTDERVECESVNGKGEFIKIEEIQNIPKAPVIILFGFKVRYLIDTFREKSKCSAIITIDTDLCEEELSKSYHKKDSRTDLPSQRDFLYNSSAGEKWKVKEERMHRLEDYSNRLEVSYSILQFFYTSFCRHFFTAEHTVLMEQIKNSYNFAQTECLIKAKIRFEKVGDLMYSFLVEEQIKAIDMNFNEETNEEFSTKLAYHFIFKQSMEEKISKILVNLAQKAYLGIQGEIGCNEEISELMTSISQERKYINFVFWYKSKEMMEQFKKTFIYKIKKHKKFQIEQEAQVPQTLQDNRKTSSQGFGSKYFQEDHKPEEEAIKIQLFEDISQQQFQSEIKDYPSQPLLRIFLTKQRYTINSPHIVEHCIAERYQQQKLQFELFFIECCKKKYSSVSYDTFKKMIQKIDASFGLHQIYQFIQKKNHH